MPNVYVYLSKIFENLQKIVKKLKLKIKKWKKKLQSEIFVNRGQMSQKQNRLMALCYKQCSLKGILIYWYISRGKQHLGHFWIIKLSNCFCFGCFRDHEIFFKIIWDEMFYVRFMLREHPGLRFGRLHAMQTQFWYGFHLNARDCHCL